jgi:cytochrome c peroxidase
MTRQGGRCLGMALVLATVVGGWLVAPSARGQSGDRERVSAVTVANESGAARTINVSGGPVVDDGDPFFLDLGINGRRCVTCHQPDENMGVSAAGVQARFRATRGTDPIFRTNDGSNSPLADVSTHDARRAAYSMLLRKGVIRVGLSIPANAEFELAAVRDPYGYAGHNANNNELSLFRRPLPSTNLVFLSTVMWDGRETLQRGSAAAIHFDLADQANSATQGHAQAPRPIDQATREAIFDFETGLFTAQVFDSRAGKLDSGGAEGGPDSLSLQPFVFGGNDPLGCDVNGANCNPQNAVFNPVVFTEFDA